MSNEVKLLPQGINDFGRIFDTEVLEFLEVVEKFLVVVAGAAGVGFVERVVGSLDVEKHQVGEVVHIPVMNID